MIFGPARRIVLSLSLVLFLCAAFAAAEEKSNGLVVFPVFSYAPETRMALGIFGMLVKRDPAGMPDDRPSCARFLLIHTQNSQTVLQLNPEYVTKDRKYIFGASFGYVNYPSKFFGIGNDTSKDSEEDYGMKVGNIQLSAQKQVSGVSRFGIRLDHWDLQLFDLDPAGALAAKLIPGSSGGRTDGAGLTYEYDSRDNIFSAARGSYHNIYAGVSDKSLGSDFGYVKYEANFRRYIPLPSGRVLALHAKLDINNGGMPFQLMPFVGGPNMLRGYYEDRFKDKNFIGCQAEYRFPVHEKITACVFGAAGEVAGRLEDFRADAVKPSAGAGIRFILDKKERISVRTDYGVGVDSAGLYINIAEAF